MSCYDRQWYGYTTSRGYRCVWHLYFFFSSRRRHTRFDCDWSSDVCSSDLRIVVICAHHPRAAENLDPLVIPIHRTAAVVDRADDPVGKLENGHGGIHVAQRTDRKSVV